MRNPLRRKLADYIELAVDTAGNVTAVYPSPKVVAEVKRRHISRKAR